MPLRRLSIVLVLSADVSTFFLTFIIAHLLGNLLAHVLVHNVADLLRNFLANLFGFAFRDLVLRDNTGVLF